MHVLAVNAMGLHLLDWLKFEDLVALCEELNRWSFSASSRTSFGREIDMPSMWIGTVRCGGRAELLLGVMLGTCAMATVALTTSVLRLGQSVRVLRKMLTTAATVAAVLLLLDGLLTRLLQFSPGSWASRSAAIS